MARTLWPAVYALRNAEALAALQTVTGPADAPPAQASDETGWVKDWVERSRLALKSAAEFAARAATEPARVTADVLRDRAQRIAEQVAAGAKNIRQAARNASAEVLRQVGEVHETARTLLTAVTAGEIALIVVALVAAALWFGR